METMFWVWLGIIAGTLLIEIITLDLVSVWFSVGGVIPFILAGIGGVPIELQICIFIVVSALLIIFVRKSAQKLLFKNMNTQTNVDAHIGKQCRMLENATSDKNGSIKINDIVWTAVSEDGTDLMAGDLVEITKVEGNKMFVKKAAEKVVENRKEEADV